MSRHRPICKMADEFPDLSLRIFFDPHVLHDLENENENELLASVDIEHPVSNSTNYTMLESEISEQVTDENTEPASSNIKVYQRFVNMSSAEIDEIIKQRRKTPKRTQNGLSEFLKVRFMTFDVAKRS